MEFDCLKCGQHVVSSSKRKYCSRECAQSHWNKTSPKKRASVAKWMAANPDKVKEIKLKHYYGITIEQYKAMKANQGDVCKICKQVCLSGRDLSVDHDHKTGQVRALLCHKCNYLLGSANDNVHILQNAIEYLREHNASSSVQ